MKKSSGDNPCGFHLINKMKKEAMFFVLILFLIINFSFVFAQNETAKKGYDCLASKVEEKCSSLAPEEKIFSLLAIGECKEELLDSSSGGECWPESGCNIKTTSQAMLALRENSANVDEPLAWLMEKQAPASQLDWFVQIDSGKPVKCRASYSDRTYNFEIDAEKKLSASAGSCLGLSEQDYWFEVSQTCYGDNFVISCNESFKTSLLYKEQSSSTFYVSEQMHSSSADGTTTEKVESFCFKEATSCDYEGTLWATLALKKLRQNTSAYIPYLISLAEENSRYLPEAFLYILAGESYRNEVLLKQKEEQWWIESGDKFYDTAVALYPFQYDNPLEKTNSIEWLGEVQGTDGCWQGNIKNTAFLLYSVFPKKAQVIAGQKDCEDEGNYCTSSPNCKSVDGTELFDYSGCFGSNICCDKQYLAPTCGEQGGEICPSGEICSGGEDIPASDLEGNEKCCFEGTCQTPQQEATCGRYSGTCRSSCLSNEDETQYSCDGSGTCCVEKTAPARSYTGIIIFSILIVLVVLGIVFRKKLRMLVDQITKKKGTGTPSSFGQQRPGPFGPGSLPPSTPAGMPQRTMPRRIIPSQQPPRRPLPPRKQEGDFNEVLRKLKEMGK